MFDPVTTERITKLNMLRIDANQAGLYAIEESPGKWACIRKLDSCFLTRGERSESLALSCGLARVKVL
jgi:hypothetical protein